MIASFPHTFENHTSAECPCVDAMREKGIDCARTHLVRKSSSYPKQTDWRHFAFSVPADHVRLIRTAVKETRGLYRSLREYPHVADGSDEVTVRAVAVAAAYLCAADNVFHEDGLAAFVNGYQEITELQMGELWALKPALQYALLTQIAAADETLPV